MSTPYSTQQLHDPSQPPPLPGTTAASSAPQSVAPPQRTDDAGSEGKNAFDAERPQHTDNQVGPEGRNAFNSERPMGVTPAPEGGVAIGGKSNLPEGHANVADKIIGKTQKVIGKYTDNPELHEKGELRETGGKAAAQGRARAAHD